MSRLFLLCVSLASLNYLVSKVDKTSSKSREFNKIDEMVDWVSLLGHEGIGLGLVEPDLGLHHSAPTGVNGLEGTCI